MRRALPLLTLVLLAGAAGWLWYSQTVSRSGPDGAPAPPPAEGPATLASPAEAPRAEPDGVVPAEAAPTAPVVRPPHPDGDAFELTLVEPPSLAYGPAPWTEADQKYAADADDLEDLQYDPALGRAARELAVFYSVHGWAASTEALQFVVNSAGAAEWGVLQSYLTTTDLAETTVAERVSQLAAKVRDLGEGIRFGVGESYTLGPQPRRVVAVVVSRGGLYLDPIPRQVKPRSTVRISGTLPRDARDVRLEVMGPDLRFVDVEPNQSGERFTGVVEVPADAGQLFVEIVARLPGGPMPLAQLELHVATPLPKTYRGYWPPDESGITSAAAAERKALALLQGDRSRHGLAPLVLDPALSRIARGHSQDMRDANFVGHTSPTTGSVGDRLQRAGYAAISYAENVAANGSLWDAQAGLFYSLGHRKNVLSEDLPRVGIGVAARSSHGRRQWLLTQVFARPAPVVDPSRARETLTAQVLAALAEAGQDAVASPVLGRAAQTEATTGEATPRGALDRAGGALRSGGHAWVMTAADLAHFEPPAALFTRNVAAVGVGVHQLRDAPPPNIVIVLLSSDRR